MRSVLNDAFAILFSDCPYKKHMVYRGIHYFSYFYS